MNRKLLALLVILFGFQWSIVAQKEIPKQIIDNCLSLPISEQPECLLTSAESYFHKDFAIANSICEKALEISLELDNQLNLAQSYKYLAYISRNSGLYEEAIEYGSSSIELYKQLEDSMEIGFLYSIVGSCHHHLGNKDSALETFIDSEKIYLEMLKGSPQNKKVKTRLAILYNDIGLFYFSTLNDYSKAHHYFDEALIIAKIIPDSMQINSLIANIGMTYFKEENYGEALKHYHIALALAKRLNNPLFAANISSNIAHISFEENEYEKARTNYLHSLEAYIKINAIPEIGRSHQYIAKTWFKEKNFIESQKYLLKSLTYLKQSGANAELIDSYKLLGKCHKALNQFDSALYYFQAYTLLKDSINEEESEKRFEELIVKYESEKKETENKLLKVANEKQVSFQRLLIAMIIVIILTSIILFMYLNQKRRNHSQNKQLVVKENENLKERLDFRDKELASNAINLAKTNELSISVAKEIEKILPKTNPEVNDLLLSIKKNLELNINNSAWKEFETRFENVHSGFYNKLKSDFTGLTPNELKICAFLKLNMSTKDIASLTNRSVRTIDSTRLSIRKKLNLSGEINLVDFLMDY